MKTSIEFLPDEVLLKLFGYVPQTCLFQNVALVNRRFSNIIKDPSLVKNLIIRKVVDRKLFQGIQGYIGRLHLLQKLEVPGSFQTHYIEPLISIILEHCPNLEHLAIVNQVCKLSDEIVFLLKSLGKNLTYLDLRKVMIRAEALFNITQMTQLKTLLLGNLCQLDVRHFQSIAENCEDLETLAIEFTEIGNEAVQYLSKTPNLKTLEMKNVYVFSNVTKDVSFGKLEYIRIENVKVIGTFYPFGQEIKPKILKDDILKLLSNFPKLKEFYMFQYTGLEYGTEVSDEFFQHMKKNYEVDIVAESCKIRITKMIK